MGCDIHLYVEVHKSNRWTFHDWKKRYEIGMTEYGPDHDSKMFDDPLYVDRNYNLFAILADVRNGYEFAGIKTRGRFNPIISPRGVPEDASPEYIKESEDYGEDGHSHSYYTVKEITDYDWQQVTVHEGWVDPWNFALWRKNGKPGGWSGGVSGGSVEHVTNRQMAHLLDSGDIRFKGPETDGTGFQDRPYTTPLQREMRTWPLPKGSVGKGMADRGIQYYTSVEWKETYATSCENFLTKTLPALKELGTPEDVRLVFFFDN